MILSTHEGQGAPSNSIDNMICFPALKRFSIVGVRPIEPRFLTSEACGVGNDEESFPLVIQAERGSGNRVPLCIIPDALKPFENLGKS